MSSFYQYSCIHIPFIRCWSNGIGRNGNFKQTINLDQGCWGKGTVVHEIGQFHVSLCHHYNHYNQHHHNYRQYLFQYLLLSLSS